MITKKVYVSIPEEGGQVSLKMQRGGARKGAGRKAKGIRKPVKINLPEEEWQYIEELINAEGSEIKTMSDYFRALHYNGKV